MCQSKQPQRDKSSEKVGSGGAAGGSGSKNDFGIPAKQAQANDMRPNVGERDMEDHDDDHRGIEGVSTGGQRTKGVGSKGRGKPGSGSGGDVDTDVLGVGTDGSGISATGPDDEIGKAAVGVEKPRKGRKVPPLSVPKGSFVDRGDRIDGVENVDETGQGMAAGTDDASAGEVSSDEASGRNDEGE